MEVILIGTLLFVLEIVPITWTIFTSTNHLQWACDILHSLPFGLPKKCFEVHLLITNFYYFIIASWGCHIIAALFMVGTGYRAVDPVGDGSAGLPGCCVQCPQLSVECLTCWSGKDGDAGAFSGGTSYFPIHDDYSTNSLGSKRLSSGAPFPEVM